MDVKFYPDYFLLFIESSETDQYWVPISHSNLITCPSRALERYADLGEIDFDSDLPLFRGINAPNAKSKLRRSKLSYSRVREFVKEAFKNSIDSSLICVHSLTAGGASAAANNGIPDRLLKVNRQQPRSARLRPIQKIPTPIKLLISPLLEMINQICKKYSLENYQDRKTSADTCDIFSEVTPENELINSLPV